MKDMTKSDCDGMEKAQNKYVSFSYIVDRSWVPPARCTMHILERKNLGSVPSSDDVLELLKIKKKEKTLLIMFMIISGEERYRY